MDSKLILVTGVSGTGKSTVCKELGKRGINVIGVDETPGLCSWVHKETGNKVTKKIDFSEDFLSKHGWMCDLSLLRDIANKMSGPVVVCGNIENVLECMKFCDKTLLLVCSPETFLKRINERSDNEYGKDDASRQALLGYYQSDNKKILEAGAVPIDAEKTISEVVDEVLAHIE